MFNIKLENEYGDILEFSQNSPFTITEISGLHPPDATINTSEIALFDGGKFNSSKVNMRSINMTIAIEYEAAKNRIGLYKVLKPKQYIKLYYKGSYRDVNIEGYIQSMQIDYFEVKQLVHLAILCPFPYFRAAQEMINDIDSVISLFHFPFAITASNPIPLGYIETLSDIMIRNEGDVQCGMMIELYARGTVKNPKIFNYLTGKFIGLNFTMIAGDSIFINTQAGKKSVQLLREGQYSNIFNTLIKNIEWLQLDVGENTFTYEAESGVNSLYITFTHTPIFEGV